MGASGSKSGSDLALAPPEGTPIRFVRLSKLQEHGQFPRFGSKEGYAHPVTAETNVNMCEPHSAFDPATTCFVYVSGRWMRPDKRREKAHPDDEEHRMCNTLLKALEKLCGGHDGLSASGREIPKGFEVAVWLGYCCIDQDDPPLAELANIGRVIQACDMVLTPIVDPDSKKWPRPSEWTDFMPGHAQQYKAEAWQEYWRDAWCRAEAMLCLAKPVDPARGATFRGATAPEANLACAIAAGRRPHLLYGTKELEGGFWPHFLPPVKSSKFEVEMNPEKGSVPRKADAAIVRYLVTEAGEALAKK